MDWGKKNDLPPDPKTYQEPSSMMTPSRALEIKEWLEGLSDECHEVAMIILNGPTEVLDIPLTAGKKMVMGALRRHLREEKKWSWPKIWGTFQEIKAEVTAL